MDPKDIINIDWPNHDRNDEENIGHDNENDTGWRVCVVSSNQET